MLISNFKVIHNFFFYFIKILINIKIFFIYVDKSVDINIILWTTLFEFLY